MCVTLHYSANGILPHKTISIWRFIIFYPVTFFTDHFILVSLGIFSSFNWENLNMIKRIADESVSISGSFFFGQFYSSGGKGKLWAPRNPHEIDGQYEIMIFKSWTTKINFQAASFSPKPTFKQRNILLKTHNARDYPVTHQKAVGLRGWTIH